LGNLLQAKMLAPHVDTPAASLKAARLMEYHDFIKLVREMAARDRQQ
jgi:hypothetical protein